MNSVCTYAIEGDDEGDHKWGELLFEGLLLSITAYPHFKSLQSNGNSPKYNSNMFLGSRTHVRFAKTHLG